MLVVYHGDTNDLGEGDELNSNKQVEIDLTW
jgi:hypothetical protein